MRACHAGCCSGGTHEPIRRLALTEPSTEGCNFSDAAFELSVMPDLLRSCNLACNASIVIGAACLVTGFFLALACMVLNGWPVNFGAYL